MAKANFVNWENILLLCIDTAKVEAEIKWEDLGDCGILFPHIYGLLNINAIIDIMAFNKNSDNEFILPKQLYEFIV